MFRLSTVIGTLSVLTISLLWFIQLGSRVDTPSISKKTENKSSLAYSEQVRLGVRKDIWLAEAEGQRLHHRIESDRSLISFLPKGESIEVSEHLFGVRCRVQEKSVSSKEPLQQIRFMLAEEGVYRYKDQSFRAEDVFLSLYKIPGTVLPKSLENYTPFLRGNAESVTFSLKNGSPKFVASRFNASLGDKTP